MKGGERAPLAIVVNSRLASSASNRITLGHNYTIRDLRDEDVKEADQLCKDSFPIQYDERWIQDVCAGRFISFGLFHFDRLTSMLVAEIKVLENCDIEDQNISCKPDNLVCYIMSLAVRASYRRRGVGRLLLEHLKETTHDQLPYPRIFYLHVLSENKVAIEFYKNNGFLHHATLVNYYLIDGIYHDGHTFVHYANGRSSNWPLHETFATLAASSYIIQLQLILASNNSSNPIFASVLLTLYVFHEMRFFFNKACNLWITKSFDSYVTVSSSA